MFLEVDSNQNNDYNKKERERSGIFKYSVQYNCTDMAYKIGRRKKSKEKPVMSWFRNMKSYKFSNSLGRVDLKGKKMRSKQCDSRWNTKKSCVVRGVKCVAFGHTSSTLLRKLDLWVSRSRNSVGSIDGTFPFFKRVVFIHTAQTYVQVERWLPTMPRQIWREMCISYNINQPYKLGRFLIRAISQRDKLQCF